MRSPLTDDVVRLELQGSGRWYVDGGPRPDLDASGLVLDHPDLARRLP